MIRLQRTSGAPWVCAIGKREGWRGGPVMGVVGNKPADLREVAAVRIQARIHCSSAKPRRTNCPTTVPSVAETPTRSVKFEQRAEGLRTPARASWLPGSGRRAYVLPHVTTAALNASTRASR